MDHCECEFLNLILDLALHLAAHFEAGHIAKRRVLCDVHTSGLAQSFASLRVESQLMRSCVLLRVG